MVKTVNNQYTNGTNRFVWVAYVIRYTGFSIYSQSKWIFYCLHWANTKKLINKHINKQSKAKPIHIFYVVNGFNARKHCVTLWHDTQWILLCLLFNSFCRKFVPPKIIYCYCFISTQRVSFYASFFFFYLLPLFSQSFWTDWLTLFLRVIFIKLFICLQTVVLHSSRWQRGVLLLFPFEHCKN